MGNNQILEELKSLEESSSFISKNFLRLQRDFGNKFIAVNKSSILANAESFEGILKEVKERKINQSEIVVQFIPQVGQIILY
jgi:hypothetical protein